MYYTHVKPYLCTTKSSLPVTFIYRLANAREESPVVGDEDSMRRIPLIKNVLASKILPAETKNHDQITPSS